MIQIVLFLLLLGRPEWHNKQCANINEARGEHSALLHYLRDHESEI